MPSAKSNYSNVGLPTPLVKRIKTFIEKNPEKGFTSVSDFVKHATREKLDNYEKEL